MRNVLRQVFAYCPEPVRHPPDLSPLTSEIPEAIFQKPAWFPASEIIYHIDEFFQPGVGTGFESEGDMRHVCQQGLRVC